MYKLLLSSILTFASLNAKEASSVAATFNVNIPISSMKKITAEEAQSLKAANKTTNITHTSVYKPNK